MLTKPDRIVTKVLNLFAEFKIRTGWQKHALNFGFGKQVAADTERFNSQIADA